MNSNDIATAPPRPGRPTRVAADRLTARIVDCATGQFMRNGYAATAIEAVAAEARVGKNTIYRRFATKSDLFQAVVDRQMHAILPPLESIAADDDLEGALRRLAVSLVEAALKPETTALQRLIIAEAERFPEIAAICIERAYKPAIAIARAVLKHGGKDKTKDPEFAAEQFVACLAYGPHLFALLGRRDLGRGEEIGRYVNRALTLFIEGWSDRA